MKIKKVWRIVLISISILIIALLLVILTKINYKKTDLVQIEYRTDTAPLIKHFPTLDGINRAYWKSGTYGETDIGPSDTWLKGFVLLDEISFDKIQSEYDWSE